MSAEQRAGGLLDTSVVILLGKVVSTVLPRSPFISAITLAELAVGPLVTDDESERLARQARLLQAEADFDPIPFDDQAARAFGAVAANLRRMGRKSTARSLDAMIAATAISRGLPLFTANPHDFEGIDWLEIVPVTLDSA
jgi:predicted nucleic acid-binding protein